MNVQTESDDLKRFGFKRGLGGVQPVSSMKEAMELLDSLGCLPEFVFGYVTPGSSPKVVMFLEASAERKRPKGMVETLLPVGSQ